MLSLAASLKHHCTFTASAIERSGITTEETSDQLTCGDCQQLLYEYRDDELEACLRSLVQGHLDRCPPCQRELRVIETAS